MALGQWLLFLSPKHWQLQDFWPHGPQTCELEVYLSLSHKLRQRPPPVLLRQQVPHYQQKTDLLLPAATRDQVTLLTSGVIYDALLIGSISSQSLKIGCNFIIRTWGMFQEESTNKFSITLIICFPLVAIKTEKKTKNKTPKQTPPKPIIINQFRVVQSCKFGFFYDLP